MPQPHPQSTGKRGTVNHPTATTTTADTAAFLAARFRDLGPEERIEIRPFYPDGKPGPRFWTDDPAEAARRGLALRGDLNVFYSVNPRRKGGGKKVDVTSVRTFWADLDFKHFPDGEAGAWAALRSFPLPPTCVVHSGQGLHVYWNLTAPLRITGPDDPTIGRVEGLLSRLYAHLGGLDSVQDLSRVMRLPGSFNRKSDPPLPVTIVEHNPGTHYRLEDFEALLPAPQATAPPRRPPQAPANGPTLDGEARLAAAQRDPKFQRLWLGNDQEYQDNPSDADLAFCLKALGYTGGDRALVDEWYRRSPRARHKWDERHYGDGRTYGQGTLDKALEHWDGWIWDPAYRSGGVQTLPPPPNRTPTTTLTTWGPSTPRRCARDSAPSAAADGRPRTAPSAPRRTWPRRSTRSASSSSRCATSTFPTAPRS